MSAIPITRARLLVERPWRPISRDLGDGPSPAG